MGLFSKKTLICERCGKEYQVRVALGSHLCDECAAREKQKRDNVRGYVDYAAQIGRPQYTEEQLDQIAAYRQAVLEKYRQTQGISRAELQDVSEHYRKLSDEQAADVLMRVANSSITSTIGAAYSGTFFAPTAFERTVVDAEDVFAVGYVTNHQIQSSSSEVLLCVVFTNDPYLSAFPMLYAGKLGFFELMKSKSGRRGVSFFFESLCPNLTYPVQELRQLKKQIKTDGEVKGNISKEVMLDIISDASSNVGIYNVKDMHSDLLPASAAMLDEYGYIQEEQIDEILKMDKALNRSYWKKQIKRLSKYEVED